MSAAALLAEAISRELDDQGFVVWRNFLDNDAIDHHLERFERRVGHIRLSGLATDDPLRTTHAASRREFFADPENFIDLVLNDKVIDFARHRFSGAPAVKNIGTHFYSLQSMIHADNINTIAPDPQEHDFRFWCALEDINPRSGPLYLYPESHRRVSAIIQEEFLDRYPEYIVLFEEWPTYRFPSQIWSDWYSKLTSLTFELVNSRGLQKAIPRLSKGDAIIFLGATVHGTQAPDHPELTRKAIIFNVFNSESPFYGMHAYWGKRHDLRNAANAIHFKSKTTRRGLVIDEYIETLNAYYDRPLVRPKVF